MKRAITFKELARRSTMARHTRACITKDSPVLLKCVDGESVVSAAHLIMCHRFFQDFGKPGDGAGGMSSTVHATIMVPFKQEVADVIVRAGERFCSNHAETKKTWTVQRWQINMPTTVDAMGALPLKLPDRLRNTVEGAEELAAACVVLNTAIPMVRGVEQDACCSLMDFALANLALAIPGQFVPSPSWTAEQRAEALRKNAWFNFLGQSTRVDGMLRFLLLHPHYAEVRGCLCGYAFGEVAVAQVLSGPLRLCVHSLSQDTVPSTTATIPFLKDVDRQVGDTAFNLDGSSMDGGKLGRKRKVAAVSKGRTQQCAWTDAGIGSIADFLRRPEDEDKEEMVMAAGAAGERRNVRVPHVADDKASYKGISVDPVAGLVCLCFQAEADGASVCQVFRLDQPGDPLGSVEVTGLSSTTFFPGALAITTIMGQVLVYKILKKERLAKIPHILQGSAHNPKGSAKLRTVATDGQLIFAANPKGVFVWLMTPEAGSEITTAFHVWKMPSPSPSAPQTAKLRNVHVHCSPAAAGHALIIAAARFNRPSLTADKYVSIGWYLVKVPPGKRSAPSGGGGIAKRAAFVPASTTAPADAAEGGGGSAPRRATSPQPACALNHWIVPADADARDLTCWTALPDLRTIATGSADGQVALYNMAGGMLMQVIQVTGRRVRSLDFSPDMGKVLIGQDAEPGVNAAHAVVKNTMPPYAVVRQFHGKVPGWFVRFVSTVAF